MTSSYTLLEQFKIRLRKFSVDSETGQTVFDDSEDLLLQQLLDEAELDVLHYRQYPDGWSRDRIQDDLIKYSNIILKLALYDYNKEGSEFEESNSENGDTRKFVTKQSILNDITPLVTVL